MPALGRLACTCSVVRYDGVRANLWVLIGVPDRGADASLASLASLNGGAFRAQLGSHSTARDGTARHGTGWLGTGRLGTAPFGTGRHGTDLTGLPREVAAVSVHPLERRQV
jgi:hypothetical protein